MRTWFALTWVLVACGSPARPVFPNAPAVTVQSVAHQSDRPRKPGKLDTKSDAHFAVRKAYALWSTGRKQEGLARMRDVVVALEDPASRAHGGLAEHREAGAGVEFSRSDDGQWLAVKSSAGAVIIDARTGDPVSLLDLGSDYDDIDGIGSFLPGTRLLPIGGSVSGGVFDVQTGARVQGLDMNAFNVTAPGILAYADQGCPPTIHVWDTFSRTERRVIATQLDCMNDFAWTEEPRLVVIANGSGHEVYDVTTGKLLVRYDGGRDTARPSASPDGKWLAYGVTASDNTPLKGHLTLLERRTGRVTGTSRICPYPSSVAFSSSSKMLAVGDLRRACLFEVPSLRLIARTDVVRASTGPDDVEQYTRVAFRVQDSLLEVSTADAFVGVFDLHGRTVWMGNGPAGIGSIGGVYVSTTGVYVTDWKTVWTVSAGRAIRYRDLKLEEMAGSVLVPELGVARWGGMEPDDQTSARARSRLCHVGDWIFPRDACESRAVTSP